MSIIFSIILSANTVLSQSVISKAEFCRDYIKGTLFNADTSECVVVSVVTDDNGNDQAIFETYIVTDKEEE